MYKKPWRKLIGEQSIMAEENAVVSLEQNIGNNRS